MNTAQPIEVSKPDLKVIESAGIEKSEHLLHPVIDALMLGGLSILFFVAIQLFVPAEANIAKMAWTMAYLAFIANHPHFITSYVLLYRDCRSQILKNWKFAWAGIVAPLLLAGALFWASRVAMETADRKYLGYMANLMFFLVGHHYVKQIYGCMIVMSGKKKFYLSKTESWSLWASMYAVWSLSFVNGNQVIARMLDFRGVYYQTLALNAVWLERSYLLCGMTAAIFLGLMVKRYIADGKIMPFASWVTFASIYVWYIPKFQHPHYFYMIPFFHSIQYLAFSMALAKNKAKHLSAHLGDTPAGRASFLKQIGVFAGLTLVIGYLCFEYVPEKLDRTMQMGGLLGPTIFMFYFHLFINIHHYIIDAVLWRKENVEVRNHL